MKRNYDRPLSADELAAMPDEDIDYSDAPELDEAFWQRARVLVPPAPKQQLTLRVDGDVLDWFRAQGRGYQTRMNAVLRAYYESRRRDRQGRRG